MKANELMIGDWVRHRWTCSDTGREVVRDFQLAAIQQNGSYLYAWSKGGNAGNIEDIEPIPLTAEILGKNGFSKDEQFFVLADDYYDILIMEWSDSIYRVRVDFLEFSSTPYSQILVSHIHELQNFLRLCGIDKDIVL